MFSDDYLDKLVAKIDLEKSSPYQPPKPDTATGEDTTHYVVADKLGNVVSMTQTLGYGYGSKVMVPGYGFWLNNSAAFATFDPPGGRMDVAPGKRKSAFVSPSIITKDGNFWAAIGTPGGSGIVQTVPQMILNLIEYDMDVQQAILAPRIRWSSPDNVRVEGRISEEVIKALEAKGHTIEVIEDIARSVGNAHGIRFDRTTGTFYGAADPRGIGIALGN
jgi:gamma-glutamyltranspeptidase/glutathione hydrolase